MTNASRRSRHWRSLSVPISFANGYKNGDSFVLLKLENLLELESTRGGICPAAAFRFGAMPEHDTAADSPAGSC